MVLYLRQQIHVVYCCRDLSEAFLVPDTKWELDSFSKGMWGHRPSNVEKFCRNVSLCFDTFGPVNAHHAFEHLKAMMRETAGFSAPNFTVTFKRCELKRTCCHKSGSNLSLIMDLCSQKHWIIVVIMCFYFTVVLMYLLHVSVACSLTQKDTFFACFFIKPVRDFWDNVPSLLNEGQCRGDRKWGETETRQNIQQRSPAGH